MNPKEPVNPLGEGKQQIPALFYAMRNKCLAIPLLDAWSDYL